MTPDEHAAIMDGLLHPPRESYVDAVRREERQKCAQFVERWLRGVFAYSAESSVGESEMVKRIRAGQYDIE